ncbi:Wadjet anti-phage system protein JetD domain-containing protein [Ornithinibacillus sp. JPR2-1]|uniref:Wadjet anti-phage system protein JetD domain-containing protein n=1 Tax=Ornithinibacillus sp. JPR2-1 TaxID=2094019 RepID=UPI0031CF84BC
MKNIVIQALLNYSKKSIEIEALEKLVDEYKLSYQDFAILILSLEEEGILEMVKSKGRNSRTPSLAHTYRIQKQLLREDFHQEIKQYRIQLHPSIQLDPYFRLNPSQWKQDIPFLLKIHQYIASFGLPTYEVPAPERSVELVGDEKWISEKQGKELLERIGLWEEMKVIPVSDPLMFAVNPSRLTCSTQLHLVVENKTTYQALLDELPNTIFSTLIYGSGKKIIKSIEHFERQLPLPGVKQLFYYFGDLDRAGITIWYQLAKKVSMKLALPFYQACLQKTPLVGKTNQRLDEEANEAFLACFNQKEQSQLQNIIDNGQYYPQEVLKTKELQHIWRNAQWN